MEKVKCTMVAMTPVSILGNKFVYTNFMYECPYGKFDFPVHINNLHKNNFNNYYSRTAKHIMPSGNSRCLQ